MKEVVYISWMRLTEKAERDWYISYLIDNGVDVEYWDVTGLLFPDLKFQRSLDRKYLTEISNYGQLESLLTAKDVTQTNFVMVVCYEGRFNRLYRLLTDYGCRLYFIEWGKFPTRDCSGSLDKLRILFHNPKRFTVLLASKLRSTYAKFLKQVKPFDVVFAAGAACMAMHPSAGKHVAVNLCDYDNYLQAQDKQRVLPDTRYAVFLDLNMALHSDKRLVGLPNLDPETYRASLNRFFCMVEKQFGIMVVVAAHPQSNYEPHFFEGRKILKGVTPELVKDADFVISHHSTSNSYAVLNLKSLLFIYTDEIEKVYSDSLLPYILDISEYLGQPAINVDKLKFDSLISLVKPDIQRYELYKYNYLTNRESEDCLSRDVVLAELMA